MISGMALSVSRVLELYDVDLTKGELHHKRSVGLAKAGSVAGCTYKNGYRYISIDQTDYMEHNLIWFVATGELLPTKTHEIDHRNRKRSDNRLDNLRKATRSQNNYNAGLRKDNSSGVRGVYFDNTKKKYIVQVTANKKTHTLGRFNSLAEAEAVAVAARARLHGAFAHENT